MEWNDYQLILAVAQEASVRGAARRLGVSHATVSRRLAYLNALPTGPLIQKSPRGLWPTKAGSAVVEAAEKIERLTDESARLQRAAQGDLSGPLTISVSARVLKHLLFDAVAQFADLYPQIELTLDGSDAFADLDRAEADLVIRAAQSPPEHWVGRRLFAWGLSLYASKAYLAQTSKADRKWIVPPDGEPRWSNWIEQSPYPNPRRALTFTDIDGRFEAIKRGLGMGRAACFMADPDPQLVRLPGAPVVLAEPFWLLAHPDFAKTARARVAIQFFADALSAKRALIEGRHTIV